MNSPGGLEVDESRMQNPIVLPDTEGLQALPAEQVSEKSASAPQALPGPEKEALAIEDESAEKQIPEQPDGNKTLLLSTQPKSRRRRMLWILLGLLLIVVIVIAIAVPVATKHKGHSKSSSSAPQTFSTSGAFNGTRFQALNHENASFPSNTLFYQDFATQIRWLQKSGEDPNFQWTGGADSPPIDLPSPARNATPLACVNYTNPSSKIATVHVFYINQSDFLQEVISTDGLKTWSPGPLSRSDSAKASAKSTGLAALYSPQYLGTKKNDSAGLRLYYGGPGNQVQELAFALDSNSDSWNLQSTLDDTNGNGGIATRSIDQNGYAHLFVLNNQNQLVVWSGYFLNKLTKYPLYGSWDSTQIFTAALAENSALTYALGQVGFQDKNNNIQLVQSYPIPGSSWGDLTAVGGNNQPVHAQDATGFGAGSVFLGSGSATHGQSDPYALDVFVQVNGSTTLDCLQRSTQWTCTPLPKL
ncbi:hypothetical protein ACLMJK_001167 [Lecanora helva]